MRITIPWGGIALIGGTYVLAATDLPSIIGWVAVVWGILSLILHIMAVIALMGVRKMVAKMSPEDIQKMLDTNSKVMQTYKTNHGRTRSVRSTSKQS